MEHAIFKKKIHIYVTKQKPWALKTRFKAYTQCITYSGVGNKGLHY
jgi:hypothetical protein